MRPGLAIEPERRFDLVTPEHIPLPFELAPLTPRALAFGIDLAIMTGGLLALILLAVIALSRAATQDGFLLAIALLGSFLIRNFYFSFFELKWQGQTIGKRALGLRVIARDGGPLTAQMIFARNLTRDLEVFLPLTALLAPQMVFGDEPGYVILASIAWMGALALLPAFNAAHLRVGDLVGGTMVVLVPKARLLQDLVVAPDEPLAHARHDRPPASFRFTEDQLDIYGIHELQVLEDVLRRDPATWDPGLLDEISQKIRKKIGWDRARWDVEPEAFLRAFYAAQRARLEQKMLLGKRQEKKIR